MKYIASQQKSKLGKIRNIQKSLRMEEKELLAYVQSDKIVTITKTDKISISKIQQNIIKKNYNNVVDNININENEMLNSKLNNDINYSVERYNITSKLHTVRFVSSSWELLTDNDILNLNKIKFYDRNGLIFVGSGKNPTNVHALKWLIDSILPDLIEKYNILHLHDTEPEEHFIITVIGGYWVINNLLDEDIELNIELKKEKIEFIEKYIKFIGYKNTEEMLNIIDHSRVFISPIVVSTGINTKNVLALSRGIPLVTTSAGSAGICDKCDLLPLEANIFLKRNQRNEIILSKNIKNYALNISEGYPLYVIFIIIIYFIFFYHINYKI